MDEARERELAQALANLIDGNLRQDLSTLTLFPDLAAELDALAEIDRAMEPDAALPDRLSGHKVLAEIGAGGMGRVLLAQDEALGRKVAIKTLAPRYAEDAVLRARFMNEARAMARLNHPHIVRIYRLGAAEEQPHFVMEYLEGAADCRGEPPDLATESGVDAEGGVGSALPARERHHPPRPEAGQHSGGPGPGTQAA
jgi:hypothetical protein